MNSSMVLSAVAGSSVLPLLPSSMHVDRHHPSHHHHVVFRSGQVMRVLIPYSLHVEEYRRCQQPTASSNWSIRCKENGGRDVATVMYVAWAGRTIIWLRGLSPLAQWKLGTLDLVQHDFRRSVSASARRGRGCFVRKYPLWSRIAFAHQ